MRRILLDESVPIGLRGLLPGHQVTAAAEIGLAGVTNGKLIAAAEEAGFEVLITADKNIRYQQNLTDRQVALIVLTTNHWDEIKPHGHHVLAAVEAASGGGYTVVPFPRPPLRRRPYPRPDA